MRCIIVENDMSIKIMDITEEDMPGILDGGFVDAILKVIEGEIRYANIDWTEFKFVDWKTPEIEEVEI